jgi:very-short-patch-repair endonuclease
MPIYLKRPRRNSPPPPAGGGEAAPQATLRGRGTLRARQLRLAASDAEVKLWHSLRRKQVNGLRFRRQFLLGPYFGDFVCLPARLVIEVDGSQHGEDAQRTHDARRTAWLQGEGFRVIRFSAGDVMNDLTAVLDGIEAALREPLPQAFLAGSKRLPPPARGGGAIKPAPSRKRSGE